MDSCKGLAAAAGCTFSLLFGIYADDGQGEGSLAWVSVSMAGPLFLLTNAEEFSKLFNPGMHELLLTMRNDIKKTAAVKLLILGSADVILLLTVILTAYSRGGTSLLQVLAYCLVPFNLMSAGCLAIFSQSWEYTGTGRAVWRWEVSWASVLQESAFAEQIHMRADI